MKLKACTNGPRRLAVELGLATRIGLDDTLILPDGTPAAGNAELVAAASALVNERHG